MIQKNAAPLPHRKRDRALHRIIQRHKIYVFFKIINILRKYGKIL
jgi:hypothetical protein